MVEIDGLQDMQDMLPFKHLVGTLNGSRSIDETNVVETGMMETNSRGKVVVRHGCVGEEHDGCEARDMADSVGGGA